MSLHRRHSTVKALEEDKMQAYECIAHSVSAANSRQTMVSNESYCLIVCIVSNNPPFLSNWHLSTFIALHIRPFPSVRPLLSIPLHAIRRLQEWWGVGVSGEAGPLYVARTSLKGSAPSFESRYPLSQHVARRGDTCSHSHCNIMLCSDAN